MMGDYNADATPDTDKLHQVAHGFRLAALHDLKCDQFSTLTDLKVYHCVRKIGSTRIQFLVDPALVPSE